MKKNKFNIGDMLLMSHGGLYRGVICEIDKYEQYVIYWSHPNQKIENDSYSKWEIDTNIRHGKWRYYPVVK